MVDILGTEWRTIVLKPYEADTYEFTFTVHKDPPVKTGRTKVFPGHAVMGPPDPTVDDTLTVLNFMDVSAGMGIYTINPASDLNNYWYGIAECEGTDGWTAAREAIVRKPAVYTGNHVPIGRIGQNTYGLWGTQLHRWDPLGQTWSNSVGTIGTVVNTEGIVYFDERMYFPLGVSGYCYAFETTPGVISIVQVTGVDHPTYAVWAAGSEPQTNPKVQIFAVWRDTLLALTTRVDGYLLVGSRTGNSGTWQWKNFVDTAVPDFIRIEKSFEPRTMISFPNAQNQESLWCAGRRGLKVYGDGSPMAWTPTNFDNVPPHPDMGRALSIFRPGEAMWIAGGGGDLIQYTVGGAVVPAAGPGGQKEGMPAGKRGSVISMATDLFHLYCLIQGETALGASASIVEDTSGGDAVYVPGAVATTSLIASTGKGFHPKWESSAPGGIPTKVVVSDATKVTGGTDYRVFWNLGEESWSMTCRLSTHSSRQAIQMNTGERFRSTFSPVGYQESYLEWGRFNGGSITNFKLASIAALEMEHATPSERVEYQYYTERDHEDQANNPPWRYGGTASVDSGDEPRFDGRTVMPFGMSDDGRFSKGLPFRWIRQRLRLVSSNATAPPIVTAMSLAFLPQPQDAATKSYTIYLPVDVDPLTYKTSEQIIQQLESLLSPEAGDEQFLFLQDGQQIFRAYISSISYSRIPTPDGAGALQLTVIQIPTGLPGLLGEVTHASIS